MIVYDLLCSKDHRFETWFLNSAAYEKQRKAKVIECPVCGDVKIRKAPMAPALARSARGDIEAIDNKHEMARKTMEVATKLRKVVEENCDYVGDRFAEEARRIHHRETKSRGIYGEANDKEVRELDDEGISYQRLPNFPKRND